MPVFKKMKSEINVGTPMKKILRTYKDPHLYTAAIKYYLRYANI